MYNIMRDYEKNWKKSRKYTLFSEKTKIISVLISVIFGGITILSCFIEISECIYITVVFVILLCIVLGYVGEYYDCNKDIDRARKKYEEDKMDVLDMVLFRHGIINRNKKEELLRLYKDDVAEKELIKERHFKIFKISTLFFELLALMSGLLFSPSLDNIEVFNGIVDVMIMIFMFLLLVYIGTSYDLITFRYKRIIKDIETLLLFRY